MRWQHPQLGLVSPLEFIEIAEANGSIEELGRWALLEACCTASQWSGDLSVAVNVSGVQIARGDLLADVHAALKQSCLAPSRLHLEITESCFIQNHVALSTLLQSLRDIGISIALDDFGTGYSSLSYISDFPLDKIKIDQSFVRKIATDKPSQAIVHAVKSLSTGLGLKVVCEGIEGQVEWDYLALLGCEEGQGYFFGKPQVADEFAVLLIENLNAASRRSA